MKRMLLVLIMTLAFAANSFAAVAHVQTVKTLGSVNATSVTTGSMTTSSGSLLLIGALTYNAGSTAPDATSVRLDNTNDGTHNFTSDKTLEATTSGNTHLRVSLWSLPNAASGSHTVTVALSASSQVSTVFFMEVSGAATSSITDGTGASASGATNAPASGTITTTNSNDFWVGLINADSSSFTQGSGWTIPTNGSETNTASNLTGAIEYKANPSSTTGNANLGATITGADWVSLGFAYKAAGGGGGATVVNRRTLSPRVGTRSGR